ncbi:MAG: GTP-binding protein [Clostridia bacterium]|nr:GTP-binding protein [Clostridia bacterium]
MTRIYLITGFLGSGKTTFLNHILNKGSRNRAVLMNEFGKVSMDSMTVKREGMAFIELKNGSIFCACLKDDFIEGLKQLVAMEPDEIYIESSGLADPSDMGKVMDILHRTYSKEMCTYRGTICLVDGIHFLRALDKMVSVERQIRHSHLILINKVDLIPVRSLAEIMDKIVLINPKAQILPVTYGALDMALDDLAVFDIADEDTTNRQDNKPVNTVVEFVKEPSLEALEAFLHGVSGYFFRIKGFVKIKDQIYKTDTVFDQVSVVKFEAKHTEDVEEMVNRLVFLSSEGLSSLSTLIREAQNHLSGLYRIEM